MAEAMKKALQERVMSRTIWSVPHTIGLAIMSRGSMLRQSPWRTPLPVVLGDTCSLLPLSIHRCDFSVNYICVCEFIVIHTQTLSLLSVEPWDYGAQY